MMERAYYDQENYIQTKKHFHRALVFFVIALVLLFAIPIAAFFLQNRQTKYYFILFGSILTVIDFIAVLFISFVYIRPYAAFLKFLKEAENRGKQELSGVLQEISDSSSTYISNEFHALYFLIGEKRMRFYVMPDQIKDFALGKTYRFLTYQGVILAQEEAQ